MRPLLDTQLVSYAMHGARAPSAVPVAITSVTAQELLRMQTDNLGELAYGSRHRVVNLRRRRGYLELVADHVFLRSWDSEPIHEWGHVWITDLINRGKINEFQRAAADLPRSRRRTVTRVFVYLVEHDVKVVSLTARSAERTEALLREFAVRHTFKKRFRNSLNDLLTLGTAVESERDLLTEDFLLADFARDVVKAKIRDYDNLLRVEVPKSAKRDRRTPRSRDRRGSRSSYQLIRTLRRRDAR